MQGTICILGFGSTNRSTTRLLLSRPHEEPLQPYPTSCAHRHPAKPPLSKNLTEKRGLWFVNHQSFHAFRWDGADLSGASQGGARRPARDTPNHGQGRASDPCFWRETRRETSFYVLQHKPQIVNP